jgi:hypothetical protein
VRAILSLVQIFDKELIFSTSLGQGLWLSSVALDAIERLSSRVFTKVAENDVTLKQKYQTGMRRFLATESRADGRRCLSVLNSSATNFLYWLHAT